jgi:hypothetical protein
MHNAAWLGDCGLKQEVIAYKTAFGSLAECGSAFAQGRRNPTLEKHSAALAEKQVFAFSLETAQ